MCSPNAASATKPNTDMNVRRCGNRTGLTDAGHTRNPSTWDVLTPAELNRCAGDAARRSQSCDASP
jgi:hypothetical protein